MTALALRRCPGLKDVFLGIIEIPMTLLIVYTFSLPLGEELVSRIFFPHFISHILYRGGQIEDRLPSTYPYPYPLPMTQQVAYTP
jgi:hypothetical protein